MVTIYVSSRDQQIITVDGRCMTVKAAFVRERDGFTCLQDMKPPATLDNLKLVFVHRFFSRKVEIPADLKTAMIYFLLHYPARQNVSFDCYAFVNRVKGVVEHEVCDMLKYWQICRLPWWPSTGSVVFFLSDANQFHHAAVYLGWGLYVSVWGAGGDLEIATQKSMKNDFGAGRVVLAVPR